MAKRGLRLDKDFPVVKPSSSQWGILDILHETNADRVCLAARSAGFKGDTDILLAAPLPSPVSPQQNEALGLFYIGESARRFGFRVEYWDARHEHEEVFWKKLASANTVGFTAITGYQLSEFVRLAELVKKRYPNMPVILGGAHATLTKPEVNLADPLVDFVVLGEGELRLPALLYSFYTGEGMKLVDGIGYRTEDGEFIINPSVHVPDPAKGHLVRAVSPWTMPYFKAAAARNEMILPTSRGCPWSTDSCDFCSVGKQYLDSYRGFPFELWRDDILAVHKEVRVRHIEPEDENSALAILEAQPYLPFLKELGASSHLHLRSDQLLDAQRVKWLAKMGVVRVHIGVESGNERVLNQVMHKNEHVEDHFVAARNLATAGIEMVGTYIVANPTENWEEIKQTLDLAEDLSKVFPKGGYRATIYVLAALPGTPIFYTIERMQEFNARLEERGDLKELAAWYKLPVKAEERIKLDPQLQVWGKGQERHPKVADTVQEVLGKFLIGQEGLGRLKEETHKWLWPTPTTLRGWTQVSAAYNPYLPKEWNAIYPIAGMHHNKFHKSPQNFPGWKRILIKPFEWLSDVRYRHHFFKYAAFELWLLEHLLRWASKRSVGKNLDEVHRRKFMESYSETLAGH
ncbi:MAG: radical SAM protein [bacterium]|nr:radical SAM protein [bacterium]